jgi:hypothetical protein
VNAETTKKGGRWLLRYERASNSSVGLRPEAVASFAKAGADRVIE